MLNYIIGKVSEVALETITFEANGIGYYLFVSHPEDFHVEDRLIKLYVYLQVREDEFTLYGFNSKEEKKLFLRLINVSGIGPKTTINMLSKTSVDSLVQAIETSNISYLKKLPGIGPKAAQQIVLDLKGKLVLDTSLTNKVDNANAELMDAKNALKELGFKANLVDSVLSSLANESLSADEYLKKALQLLKK